MLYLKQSTAVTVKIGPFLDDTDGKTAETGLTIAQADVRLSKNGGDIAQKNDSTSCTHDELGIYDCPLNATDTDTLGRLQLYVHKSGALPVWHEYMVIPANVYDSLFSTDKLQVDITQVAGNSVSGVNDFKADVSNLDVAVSTRSSHSAADVWSVATRALTDKSGFSLAADQSSVTIGTVNNVSDKTGYSLSSAGVDAILDEVIEGSMTLREALRIYLSALAGKSSGGGTNTITFRDLADSKNRISATVDANGNRTAVTLDGS
ncbi:MAG: hypothetical protein DRJ03_04060 [Chloroflexi bacterium]|nr:MAG: hypothetical protein DRJ03_04060 [Chloroflexota bacterium]